MASTLHLEKKENKKRKSALKPASLSLQDNVVVIVKDEYVQFINV